MEINSSADCGKQRKSIQDIFTDTLLEKKRKKSYCCVELSLNTHLEL